MNHRLQIVLVPIVYKLVLIVIMATCRIRVKGDQHLKQFRDKKQPCIISIWHNNIAVGSWTFRNQDLRVMISKSRDGDVIDRFAQQFGNKGIRGSTSSGSAKATRSILRELKENKDVVMTPDGPRGPKYKLQPGVLWLSALSGSPVIPYHIEADRQWVFNSWDEHKLPKPFSTVYTCFGETYFADRQAMKTDPDGALKDLEKHMMDNVNQAVALATGSVSST